jgi:uncharacterized protein (UPF0303 family)
MNMGEHDALLNQLEQQEKDLQFTEFSNDTAYSIGKMLVEMASQDHLSITIDITRFGQQLFHYACAGTSADNDRWIKGKIKIASMMGHSSYYCQMYFENRGTTAEQDFHLSSFEYLPSGGCFPIMITETGMVGTITVSGLPPEDDHALVVRAIQTYLSRQ